MNVTTTIPALGSPPPDWPQVVLIKSCQMRRMDVEIVLESPLGNLRAIVSGEDLVMAVRNATKGAHRDETKK